MLNANFSGEKNGQSSCSAAYPILYFSCYFWPISYEFFSDRLVRDLCRADVHHHGHGHITRDLVVPPVYLLVEHYSANVACLIIQKWYPIRESVKAYTCCVRHTSAVGDCHLDYEGVA